jgi:transposase
MGRPLSVFTLSEAEEETLRSLARRRTTAQALALRARIVLACAAGDPNQVVAGKLGVTPQTVCKWRARFVAQRLDGLHDEPRPGVPRSIDDAKVEAVIVATLETMPQGTTHWSSRGMARSSGISTSSVQRIWRAFGLQSHRTETFKLSTDPLFVAGARSDPAATAALTRPGRAAQS